MKFAATIFSLAITFLAMSGLANAGSTNIDQYPNKPINLIVPFPAGNVSDTMVRIIAAELRKTLGQPIIIDNRVGGSGLLGMSLARRALPDGYTLVIGTGGSLITAPLLQQPPPLDAVKDFAPITLLAPLPFILVANPSVPANSLSELLALARREPGKLSYGSLGTGSVPHLAMEMLLKQAGVDILHVPYKGSTQATTDLLGGRLSVTLDTVPPVMANVKAGKLKALAVTSAKRSLVAPDIPTVAEAGNLPGYEAISWTGLLAPAGTPKAIIEKINKEVGKILEMPKIKEQLLVLGLELEGSTPEQFSSFISSEKEKWGNTIKTFGVKLNL